MPIWVIWIAFHGHFHKAIQYHRHDLEIGIDNESSISQVRAHRNLALVYEQFGDSENVHLHDGKANGLDTIENRLLDMDRHGVDSFLNICTQMKSCDASLVVLISKELQLLVTATRNTLTTR